MGWQDILKAIDRRITHHRPSEKIDHKRMKEKIKEAATSIAVFRHYSRYEALIEATKFHGIDLSDRQTLEYFIYELGQLNIRLDKELKDKLFQNVFEGSYIEDYTNLIMTTVQMLRHMGKEPTKEAVMEEIDIPSWSNKYDKLLK